MLGIKINFGDQKKIDWSITRRHIYILLIFIFLTSFIFSNNIRFITFSNENERPVEFNLSSYYNNPMPCIEPYCHIQCYSTYGSTETIIRKDSLTEIQQEHLTIDLGEDVLVQKLISSIRLYSDLLKVIFRKVDLIKFSLIIKSKQSNKYVYLEKRKHSAILYQVIVEHINSILKLNSTIVEHIVQHILH